jgi:hypothetical protein
MLKGGATHTAVATDHVIESFRNGLWRDYKTSDGIEPDLLAQFPLLDEVLSAAGIIVWPMIELLPIRTGRATFETPISARSRSVGSLFLRISPLFVARLSRERIRFMHLSV